MFPYYEEESVRQLFCRETRLHKAVYIGDINWIRRLLRDGADINSLDTNGATPLHVASFITVNQTNIIQEILEHNPQMNIQDNYKRTPLNILVGRASYDISLLKSYLEHGADPNVADIYGHTSLHHIVMFPLRKRFIWFPCIKLMINHKADVNSTDRNGNTALHIAVTRGNITIIKILLECHANMNLKNCDGESPMDIAFNRSVPTVLDSLGKHLLWQFSLNMEVDKEYVERILEMERFKEFWKECNTELDQLKRDKIGDTEYSYFHMMTLSTYRMSKIFRNERTSISVLNYESSIFKIYGKHLYDCLRKAMTRNYSLTIGTIFFKHVLPYMPDIVIDNITSYFRNQELDNLSDVIVMDTSHVTKTLPEKQEAF